MGKKTNVAIAIAAAAGAAWASTKALSKPLSRSAKEALEYNQPIILAHRGGSALAPECSPSAFENAAKLGVHGFEIDIRLTKDEEIVVFHDEYTDRVTNLTGRVADYTLVELKKADLGFHFLDLNGENSYRDCGEQIMTLGELLDKYPQMLINLDIKDAPQSYEGSLMPSKLWRLLEEKQAFHRVVVTSFYDEQIDRFNLYAQNTVALGAGEREVRKAYTAFTSQFKHLYHPKADVFQIPVRSNMFPLDSASFIKFLNSLNIPVHYWTIDDPVVMRRLIDNGAKGIITDRPDLAIEALKLD
ncbi:MULTISPECIES: glycerophosphodiester phosphodiesterase [Bacillaceae]|jgi:glycerophosphoryl diester phosphodiesterase|uniref:glycerophosphodiester phosphodiesterase n=1 Tax=Bacillaceae TaxID=186817 RepID=UPI0006AF6165|nr:MULTISPECIES: glycerophosphodiester phosphodiesterase [Bacillaceae]ALC86167.1 glycerophosphodiester phosphodiesterase [Bacillus sp. FJAT-22090]KQL36573.1 glycerophosphodiester phosphodiesterase [Psychrobacillus sp. FJAT-21963]MDF2068640.1 glycerophosphodiester phosphodiesterase [Bacillus sp. Cr_A10]